MSRFFLLSVLSVAVAATSLGCAPSTSQGDAEPPPLAVQLLLQIKGGELPAFEEARRRAVAYREAEGYPWNEFVSISENNIARITTPLPNGWADMAAQREWFNTRGGGNSGMADTISRIRREILEPLPELGYEPETPRVAQGEAGWFHEIKIYTHPGTRELAQESLRAPTEALREAGSDQPRFVGRTLVGGRGTSYSVFYPAHDAADYYETAASLQPIFERARSERRAGVVQSIERINWETRPDLNYSIEN